MDLRRDGRKVSPRTIVWTTRTSLTLKVTKEPNGYGSVSLSLEKGLIHVTLDHGIDENWWNVKRSVLVIDVRPVRSFASEGMTVESS